MAERVKLPEETRAVPLKSKTTAPTIVISPTVMVVAPKVIVPV